MNKIEEIKNWQKPRFFNFVLVTGTIAKYSMTFFVFTSIICFYYLYTTKQIPGIYGLPMLFGINFMALEYLDNLIRGGYYGGHIKGFKEDLECGAELASEVITESIIEEAKKHMGEKAT